MSKKACAALLVAASLGYAVGHTHGDLVVGHAHQIKDYAREKYHNKVLPKLQEWKDTIRDKF